MEAVEDTRGKLDRLRSDLARLPAAVVAFSGGADSALLAFVAHQVLGARSVAVTAESPSLPRRELDEARAFAGRHGIRHRVVRTGELEDARYVRNTGQRCAFCKDALMEALLALPERDGGPVLLGVNVDDLADHRPGQEAALAGGARFPLVDAGLSKAEVRWLSRDLGLSTWDKPAAACLASRMAYGVPVTGEALRRVEMAEETLRGLGFGGNLRVRDQGDGLARIEADPADLERLVAVREQVVRALKDAGFLYITVDLEGYRQGSQNMVLRLGRKRS